MPSATKSAEELTRELNGKYRFEAELSSQLGVLPSYTAWAWRACCPTRRSRTTPRANVLVDGKPTASSGATERDPGQPFEGMAVKADDLLAMKKEEGREFVSGTKVVYIYHNPIDAVGDDRQAPRARPSTPCGRRSTNLAISSGYVINSLNGNHIVVTADHGFLFTETAPGETDKSKLDDKPPGTVKAKKRYLHRPQPAAMPTRSGTATRQVTAGAEGDMEFWIPKGANRFHFVGGARFVHGGAMLQEIVRAGHHGPARQGQVGQGETKTKQVDGAGAWAPTTRSPRPGTASS